MVENQPMNENAPAVQTHLTIMQGVINRMAENSRSCKVWCVTLAAATLVLVLNQVWKGRDRGDAIWIGP